jgi:hypothetical protein
MARALPADAGADVAVGDDGDEEQPAVIKTASQGSTRFVKGSNSF